MLLRIALLTAVLASALKVLYIEEGSISEKLAYVYRGVTGKKTVKLSHVSRHSARPSGVFMFVH